MGGRTEIEVLDTTLRDGEQTSGVAFATHEKLGIARYLLEELGVDRLEVASARVSDGEYDAVRGISEWARKKGLLDRIEVLGFVDGGRSIEWIKNAGCLVMNLLTKGSYRHVTEQLGKTPEQHIADIKATIAAACKEGLSVNIYLEDWSNGMIHSVDYVFQMMDALKDEGIRRFMLPDTLGILSPDETYQYCKQMTDRYPDLHFDFHAHNDYDLAVGNVYAAIKAGIRGIHTTVNGLGERAGNAPLTSVLAVIHDKLKLKTNICESKIYHISKLVETYSGVRIPNNKPIIGDNVFTQCAGVHADGDSKSNLYFNDLLPERFGRVREYALGKLSGKANIRKNLEALGINIDDASMMKVTQRIIELGDKKQLVTQEELPYIVSDVLKHDANDQPIKIVNYSLSLTHGLRPVATVKIEIDGELYQQTAAGDGQYNAFTKALWKIYKQLNKPIPELLDYMVIIPPGGQTDALVHTTITWKFNGKVFKTHGLDPDQTEAAIKATVKMLNLINI
ncbi:MAG: 2-isopropylmalate synthase [Paludibacteraceae bacterium]|nr:2-isopropylmalate synthase [Paludibacteraceae bacterium]